MVIDINHLVGLNADVVMNDSNKSRLLTLFVMMCSNVRYEFLNRFTKTLRQDLTSIFHENHCVETFRTCILLLLFIRRIRYEEADITFFVCLPVFDGF